MRKITRRPDTMGGRYCLAGTRMPIIAIKHMMRDVGEEWIMREYPWITREQIADAVAFRAPTTPPQPFSAPDATQA